MLLTLFVFLFCVFVSTIYWVFLYIGLILYKEPPISNKTEKTTIALSAKNESKNLKKYLPTIAKQRHSDEVLVINDYSTDDTSSVLEKIKLEYPILNVLQPSKNHPGKKLGLTEAIGFAKNKNIVLTDADCYSTNDNWASIMSSKISSDQEVVLGYGPMEKTSGFINLFSRFETIIAAIQYLTYAIFKIPYMGVGRNICFTKAIFEKVNGYQKHMHIPSGDDDLFVQSIMDQTKVGISLNPKSFIYSNSPFTWKSYLSQKKRHMATATSYKWFHQVLLSIPPIFHICGFVLGLILLVNGNFASVIITYLIRWFLLILLGYIPYKKLDGLDLLVFLPLLDILLIPYYIYFSIFAFKKTPATTWN